MAGLAAAARARELGARVTALEKSTIGGSMLRSSGVIWRYRDFDTFRVQCPDGDVALQRVIHEQLDQDLDWLVSLGAVVTEESTGNPLTVGRRFDTAALTAALARDLDIRVAAPVESMPPAPCILATGGFQADPWLVREWISAQPLLLRSNGGSQGDGLRIGLAAGGGVFAGGGQVFRAGRAGSIRRGWTSSTGGRCRRWTRCRRTPGSRPHSYTRSTQSRSRTRPGGGTRIRSTGRSCGWSSGSRGRRGRGRGSSCLIRRSASRRATGLSLTRSGVRAGSEPRSNGATKRWRSRWPRRSRRRSVDYGSTWMAACFEATARPSVGCGRPAATSAGWRPAATCRTWRRLWWSASERPNPRSPDSERSLVGSMAR